MTLHVSQGNTGGLLHNIAQLTREHEAAFTGHGCCFDEEHVAADTGHRQAGRNTRCRCPRGGLVMDLLPAQRIPNRRGIDFDWRLPIA